MHLTALLTLAAAIIPAVTPVPAPSPQSAEIDVHLELSSKDVADFFDEHKAKTEPHHDADAAPGQTLPYAFTLKGHLQQGLEIIGPLPPHPYYQFPKVHLDEQGILSRNPTTFRLHNGKLLIGDKAVGLHGQFEKRPVPAVLVHPQQGLNFTVTHLVGSEITTLRFVDERFTFLGPKFVSGFGDRVEVGLKPRELNPLPLPPVFFSFSFPLFLLLLLLRIFYSFFFFLEKNFFLIFISPPPTNSNLASPNYHHLANREGWWGHQ